MNIQKIKEVYNDFKEPQSLGSWELKLLFDCQREDHYYMIDEPKLHENLLSLNLWYRREIDSYGWLVYRQDNDKIISEGFDLKFYKTKDGERKYFGITKNSSILYGVNQSEIMSGKFEYVCDMVGDGMESRDREDGVYYGFYDYSEAGLTAVYDTPLFVIMAKNTSSEIIEHQNKGRIIKIKLLSENEYND